MKKWAMIALGCIIVGLGIFFGGMCMLNFDFTQLDADSNYEEKEYKATVDDLEKVVAKLVNENVKIINSEDEMVHITYYESKDKKYEVKIENEVLSIQHKSKFLWMNGGKLFNGINQKSNLVILAIPANYQKDIEIHDVDGKIENTSELTAKNIIIKTTNGEINLQNINANLLEVSSTNGKFILDKVNATTITVKGVNGSVKGEQITTDSMIVKLTNGQINLVLTGKDTDYNMEFSTVNGKCNYHNQKIPTSTKQIQMKTTNGNINLQFE